VLKLLFAPSDSEDKGIFLFEILSKRQCGEKDAIHRKMTFVKVLAMISASSRLVLKRVCAFWFPKTN
jgi:hypothetical protein